MVSSATERDGLLPREAPGGGNPIGPVMSATSTTTGYLMLTTGSLC